MESDWCAVRCMPPSASMSEMEGRKEGSSGGGDEAEEKINKGESVKKGIEEDEMAEEGDDRAASSSSFPPRGERL